MFSLLKVILKLFSGEPKMLLMSKVGSSPNIKKLFFWFLEWDDELLSTSKT